MFFSESGGGNPFSAQLFLAHFSRASLIKCESGKYIENTYTAAPPLDQYNCENLIRPVNGAAAAFTHDFIFFFNEPP